MRIDSPFPSPIGRHSIEGHAALNGELETFVRSLQSNPSRAAHSLKNGFQSEATIFDEPNAAIAKLRAHIVASFNAYWPVYVGGNCLIPPRKDMAFGLWGWVTVLERGGFNTPHVHPRSTVSGVYYVKSPRRLLANPPGDYSGWLSFQDPRNGAQNWPLREQVTQFNIPPEEGVLIMFPSYMSHFVHPFDGDGERISIAFNIKHEDPGATTVKP